MVSGRARIGARGRVGLKKEIQATWEGREYWEEKLRGKGKARRVEEEGRGRRCEGKEGMEEEEEEGV